MDLYRPALTLAPATVAISDVHMTYRVRPVQRRRRSTSVPAHLRQSLRAVRPVEVHALRGVSFVARAGDSVGLLGLNGSGKSTLLRLITGLEKPRSGEIHASSTPMLLGVNAALQPELSGAENVRLGCLAMGMTPDEAQAAYRGIVNLADIGSAIHLPMKTYSSGMAARLRFAIGVAARPEILLIDEALNTGDAAFKERSTERMREMLQAAGTVFLVSHAAQTIEEECTRAIWLHRGRVIIDGRAEDVARRYRWWAWNLAKGETETAARLLREAYEKGLDTAVHLAKPPDPEAPPRHMRQVLRGQSARREDVDESSAPATSPYQRADGIADFFNEWGQ
jgi:teichoic acid transport system ATP-binding protein